MLSYTGMAGEMIKDCLGSIGRYILDNRVRFEPMKDRVGYMCSRT